MNEIVKNYLEEMNEKIKVKRGEKLVELGLFEKVFPNEEGYVDDYEQSGWDVDRQEYFYKKPIDVTEEEYDAIMKVADTEIKVKAKPNKIATFISVVAWLIYICGTIVGLEMCYKLLTGSGITYIIASFFGGSILLALVEMIKIFNDIKNKL